MLEHYINLMLRAVFVENIALAFFLGFYALTQIGMFVGKREILQPWLGAWLSNIVFLAAGMLMVWRMR